MRFVDTNILLYAASAASTDLAKAWRARRLLVDEEVALSTQVLQEFYWVATRPYKLGLSHREAQKLVELWSLFPVQPITLGVVEDALWLVEAYKIGYWDAAILAAARHLGCDVVYTEDLNAGQTYAGVVVVNPFAE